MFYQTLGICVQAQATVSFQNRQNPHRSYIHVPPKAWGRLSGIPSPLRSKRKTLRAFNIRQWFNWLLTFEIMFKTTHRLYRYLHIKHGTNIIRSSPRCIDKKASLNMLARLEFGSGDNGLVPNKPCHFACKKFDTHRDCFVTKAHQDPIRV